MSIDTSPGRTPEETVQKAAKIRAAAMAPAEPSSTDQAVAAKADRMAAEARQQIAQERAEEVSASSAGDEAESDTSAPGPVRPVGAPAEPSERGKLIDVLG